jgi:transcriptional regulator with PAS, ATPase and Fis domain
VNCPSIPFELAESELFGYEKGAFSGARNEGKPGKFELSEGGTIFLDEIGSLPLTIQAKLLRVLQEKEIERLGGRNMIKVNFRLIAATNVNLADLVAKERFRADLFYRLNTLPIKVPPLRERLEDIGLLINHFLDKISRTLGTSIPPISDEALEILTNYKWPGNIRELTNVLEQSVLNILLQQTKVIQTENLPSYVLEKRYPINEYESSLRSIVRDAEKQAIKRALLVTKGNKRRAARLLGIQRCVLYQKLNKYHSL